MNEQPPSRLDSRTFCCAWFFAVNATLLTAAFGVSAVEVQA